MSLAWREGPHSSGSTSVFLCKILLFYVLFSSSYFSYERQGVEAACIVICCWDIVNSLYNHYYMIHKDNVL